jgi:transposase/uncharacterized coiled-coil protein SlyX
MDAADPLPDDPELLKRMIRELLDALAKRDGEVEQLRQKLDRLLRRLQGPRSNPSNPFQQLLFDDPPADTPVSVPAAPHEESPSDAPHRKRRGHGRRRLPTDLPRIEERLDLSESQKRCSHCGGTCACIGEDVSEQLDYQPAALFVRRRVRPKYACGRCQGGVITAAPEPQPIAKGLPGPGLLAQVIVSKYADHLPLYRLERILGRHGVSLTRSTLCGWVAASADLLQPLYDLMVAAVLLSKKIHCDDTPVRLRRAGTRQGHVWVYLGDDGHRYTVYDFRPNHARDGPVTFLQGFKGYLQADAYAGYHDLYARGVTEVACWAHTRRYFVEAAPSEAATALEAVARIRGLYAIERRAKDLKPADRLALRQADAKPQLAALHAWLDGQRRVTLRKSPLGQAIQYALSNWAALERYTADGDLSIDNNAAERALRGVGIGRKNWLFYGSEAGGQRAAILLSMIETCRRHGVEPFAYLRDILSRLPTHPTDRLNELLPDQWKTISTSAPV